MTECPVCDVNLQLAQGTLQGELIECQDCGTELEVTNADPYALAEAPQAEEDWGE